MRWEVWKLIKRRHPEARWEWVAVKKLGEVIGPDNFRFQDKLYKRTGRVMITSYGRGKDDWPCEKS